MISDKLFTTQYWLSINKANSEKNAWSPTVQNVHWIPVARVGKNVDAFSKGPGDKIRQLRLNNN